nr:uncharacterized protein LOC113459660 [Zonotrichia albicollis]
MCKSQMSPPKCEEGPICASVSQTKLFKVAFNEKNKGFVGSERAVCTSATPEAPWQGACMEEHPNTSSAFGVSHSWLSSTTTVPEEQCQDSASRTTVSSKLIIFGETQVHINR